MNKITRMPHLVEARSIFAPPATTETGTQEWSTDGAGRLPWLIGTSDTLRSQGPLQLTPVAHVGKLEHTYKSVGLPGTESYPTVSLDPPLLSQPPLSAGPYRELS